MKKLLLYLPLSFLLACNGEKEQSSVNFTVKNQLDVERVDELVVIKRQTVEEKLGVVNNDQVIIVSNGENILPSQMDDLDMDGTWDELAFLISIEPNQELQLSLRAGDSTELPEFTKRTNVHFAKVIVKNEQYEEVVSAERIQGTNTAVTQQHFQYEGPGWENDKVGFRNYFDERNGMDIWGKTTDEMVLQNVGKGDNYHALQPWGMDILKVANSLGAGALALQYNDSLFRVTAPEGANYELVVEGPIRSVFNMNFNKIMLGEDSLFLKHQISIVAGEYAYRNKVTIKNAPADAKLVTGIVNLQTDSMYTEETDEAKIVYTHDKQSFDSEYLGMAVIAAKSVFEQAFATAEEGEGITETFAVVMEPQNQGTDFKFYAAWEKSDASFADKNYFQQFLIKEARLYSNPLTVEF